MICDAHVHVGYFQRKGHDRPFYYTPKRVSSILKRCGVEEFIFSSSSSHFGVTDIESLHNEAAETKKEFGRGAHAFCWLSGPMFEADRGLTFLDRGIYDGVKLHELETRWSTRPKDLDYILSVLEERDVPVQFHTGEDPGCYPGDYLPYVKKHPKLRVDFAHCRPGQATIDAMKECPNLYTDTAFMPPERIELLEANGVADRVMFGTDLPVMQCYYDVQLTAYYRKVLKEFLKIASDGIMAGNFRKFLRLK